MISELPLLTFITFLPVVGIVLTAVVAKDRIPIIRGITLGITLLQLVIAVLIFLNYNGSLAGVNDARSFQFVERLPWIRLSGLGIFGNLAIDYFMGLDGLSVAMVLLSAIIMVVGAVASFSIHRHIKGYFIMYLLLDIGVMGTFCALDFFLYTLLGSVAMLLVMIGLYFSNQVLLFDGAHHLIMSPLTHKPEVYHTFSMLRMMDPSAMVPGSILSGLGTTWRYIAFFALFFAFAVKIPMVPFHTWLPDAHVEAPTAISVVLAGVLLKMGGYGILRLSLGIFPEIALSLSWYMAMFGFINIVYGALCAMAQSDFKRLIAYSSVSHMGFVLLGIAALNSQGMVGAIMQMFNHGTITAMLFLIVGVLYDRTQTRGVLEFGGLANQMPKYFAITVIAFFAALGLPAMSLFISEALVFIGSFQTWQTWTIVSTLGIILTAAYFLWTLQRMFFGATPEKWNNLPDINGRELASLIPLAVIVFALGIYPAPVIDLLTSSVNALVSIVHAHGPLEHAAAALVR